MSLEGLSWVGKASPLQIGTLWAPSHVMHHGVHHSEESTLLADRMMRMMRDEYRTCKGKGDDDDVFQGGVQAAAASEDCFVDF